MGNGIGGVSSDLVTNNAAIINAANVSAGYNANSTANLPKSTITLNNTSAFNVTGANAVVNIAESAGSSITMALNDSAVFNAGDTQVRIGQGGTASLTLNGSSNFNHGATNRLLTVGTNAGSYGTVTLNGTSTFTHTANITSVGEAGTGVFNIASNTATANVRNFVIGRASGGIGAVLQQGKPSRGSMLMASSWVTVQIAPATSATTMAPRLRKTQWQRNIHFGVCQRLGCGRRRDQWHNWWQHRGHGARWKCK